MAVNLCKVVEPTTRRSPKELMVEVAEPPILKLLPVKIEEKKFVVVAEVPVALTKISPLRSWLPTARLVKMAFVEKRLVVVALPATSVDE